MTSLWRQPEFMKLWTGQTISAVGSQVTALALGLTAVAVLDASPAEVGVLGALTSVPFLLFGLLAGVWADRFRRRPILIVCDVGRAVLLASIPIGALAHSLSLLQLDIVAFCAGTLNVFFVVAYGSILPSVLRRADLAEGNARVALSEAVARVIGPSLAGAMIELVTAPIAIAVDAASFVVSAVSLAWFRASEKPSTPAERQSVLTEIIEGVRTVYRHRLLFPILVALTLGNVGDGLWFGSNIVLIFLSRDIGLDAAAIGTTFSGLGLGGLFGAAVSGFVTRAIGPGVALVASTLVWGGSVAAVSLVAPSSVSLPLLVLLFAALGTINPIAGANIATMRQAYARERFLGRVVAVNRVAVWGGVALGSLVGGVVADQVGIRPTIAVAGLLPVVGCVCVLLSPVKAVRRLDSVPDTPCSSGF